ncbi:MAG: hypothetical protein ACQEWD_02305 [Bacteroidota bacterium]
MKNYLILFSLVLLLLSCKNEENDKEAEDIQNTEQDYDAYENSDLNKPGSRSETSETNQTSRDNNMETPDSVKDGKNEEEALGRISNTKYIKVDENDAGCNCYCVDVVTTGQSELCLKDNEIYINARFSQNGNTTLVYFTKPSVKNTNDELPWEDFDTNTPIAEITPTPDGMELDWKGFSIDGELAVDYAIYGKKTLEGSYRKQ